jgi:hypothetical protein
MSAKGIAESSQIQHSPESSFKLKAQEDLRLSRSAEGYINEGQLAESYNPHRSFDSKSSSSYSYVSFSSLGSEEDIEFDSEDGIPDSPPELSLPKVEQPIRQKFVGIHFPKPACPSSGLKLEEAVKDSDEKALDTQFSILSKIDNTQALGTFLKMYPVIPQENLSRFHKMAGEDIERLSPSSVYHSVIQNLSPAEVRNLNTVLTKIGSSMLKGKITIEEYQHLASLLLFPLKEQPRGDKTSDEGLWIHVANSFNNRRNEALLQNLIMHAVTQ